MYIKLYVSESVQYPFLILYQMTFRYGEIEFSLLGSDIDEL